MGDFISSLQPLLITCHLLIPLLTPPCLSHLLIPLLIPPSYPPPCLPPLPGRRRRLRAWALGSSFPFCRAPSQGRSTRARCSTCKHTCMHLQTLQHLQQHTCACMHTQTPLAVNIVCRVAQRRAIPFPPTSPRPTNPQRPSSLFPSWLPSPTRCDEDIIYTRRDIHLRPINHSVLKGISFRILGYINKTNGGGGDDD